MDIQLLHNEEFSPRILMLVPHEPELDPRIKWVTELCAQVGRTDVIGFCWTTNKPLREYEGQIYTERITSAEYPSTTLTSYLTGFRYKGFRPIRVLYNLYSQIKQMIYNLLSPSALGMKIISHLKKVESTFRPKSKIQTENSPALLEESNPLNTPAIAPQPQIEPSNIIINCGDVYVSKGKRFERLKHTLVAIYTQDLIANSLYLRGRSVSIRPKVIICHDIYALAAAIKLKHLFGTPVIYDSHELWPEADSQASKLQKAYTISLERKLIRQADVVITVNPQIASYLERLYDIKNVLSVPNAEPLTTHTDFSDRPIKFPIRFLLQGQASPDRGIEELLESWGTLKEDKAVLILRCPENPFFACLQKRFRDMISDGHIIISSPVKEAELINAASQADVGIIPYGGPTLNHVYACPNKLSQYLQAGLAILHNSDQEFVTDVINRYNCGLSYNSKDPSKLAAAVKYFINNLEGLRNMRQNSVRATQSEFNWDFQSKSYLTAIKELYQR